MSKFLFKDKNELYNQYYPLATNTEKEEFLINNGSSLLKILEKPDTPTAKTRWVLI